MSELAPIISAIITVIAAVYLALHKNRSEEFKNLEAKSVEHGTKIARIEVRIDNLENLRDDLSEIRSRLDHIQEQMVTKRDLKIDS